MSASLNLVGLAPGTHLVLVDGRRATVVDNPKDGTWLVCRILGSDDEELVSAAEILGRE